MEVAPQANGPDFTTREKQINGWDGDNEEIMPKVTTSLKWRYVNVMASQITDHSTLCSITCSCWQQRKHQSFALPVINEGIHWSPVPSHGYLTAQSHYLNQCWLFITEVQWQLLEGNFTKYTSVINYLSLLGNHFWNFIQISQVKGWRGETLVPGPRYTCVIKLKPRGDSLSCACGAGWCIVVLNVS